MAKKSITVNLQIEGLREALRAFTLLPKDASNALRDASLELSRVLANRARADALSDAAPQSHLLAETIKAKRDRVPVIEAGGTKRLGRNKEPAYKLLFGSMFGSDAYPQFHRPHAGRDAYWFFPVIEKSAPEISHAWNEAADQIVRKFSEAP